MYVTIESTPPASTRSAAPRRSSSTALTDRGRPGGAGRRDGEGTARGSRTGGTAARPSRSASRAGSSAGSAPASPLVEQVGVLRLVGRGGPEPDTADHRAAVRRRQSHRPAGRPRPAPHRRRAGGPGPAVAPRRVTGTPPGRSRRPGRPGSRASPGSRSSWNRSACDRPSQSDCHSSSGRVAARGLQAGRDDGDRFSATRSPGHRRHSADQLPAISWTRVQRAPGRSAIRCRWRRTAAAGRAARTACRRGCRESTAAVVWCMSPVRVGRPWAGREHGEHVQQGHVEPGDRRADLERRGVGEVGAGTSCAGRRSADP